MQRTPLILLVALLLAACGDEVVAVEKTVTAADLIAEGPHAHAIIEIRDIGSIRIQLLPEVAPRAVENFIELAEADFYAGILFHRVIPGFMIQGGGFDPQMKEKATNPPITNEADNGLKNLRGTLSMARTQVKDSATSQFFINQVDMPRFDHRPPSSGSLANNLREFEALRDFFSSSTLIAIVDLPFVFIFIAVIFAIGGPIAGVPLIKLSDSYSQIFSPVRASRQYTLKS